MFTMHYFLIPAFLQDVDEPENITPEGQVLIDVLNAYTKRYALATFKTQEAARSAASYVARQLGFAVAVDTWEECPHGLSAWLCADPINHYPADNQF